MRKKVISLLGALVLLMAYSIYADNNFRIKLDNEVLEFKNATIIQNDKIYIPLREMCDKLCIPIEWNEQDDEIYVDIAHKKPLVSERTTYKEEGVIPDEETAYQVGKLLLETYVGHPLEYEDEYRVYWLETTFLEEENAWQVCQKSIAQEGVATCVRPGTTIYLIEIKLNKNTGEVLYINSYGSW